METLQQTSDQPLDSVSGRMRSGLKSCKANASTLSIENAEGRIVGADKRYRAFQNQRRDVTEIRTGVKGVGNFEQGPLRFTLTLLVGKKPGVLVADSNLAGDRFKK